MRKVVVLLLFLSLLLNVQSQKAKAENTGINNLELAINAAKAIGVKTEKDPPGNEIALQVARNVINLDIAHKKYTYALMRQDELQKRIVKAENDQKMGKSDEEVILSLQMEIAKNGFDLNNCKMQVENGEKGFFKLTGVPIPQDFNFAEIYLIADAGKLVLPPWTEQTPNYAVTSEKFGRVLESYRALGESIASYIEASDKLQVAEADFKKGKISVEILENAVASKEKARINALEWKAEYSKALYELDYELMGHISREIKQLSNPIFQGNANY